MPYKHLLTLLLAASTASAAPALAQAAPNPGRGKVLFLQCGACHSVASGAANKVGPNLFGVYGSKAGSRPGYTYSKVFQDAKFSWDETRLSDFIEKPGTVMPGTKMVFGGIADPAKRQDIIAYIKTIK